VRCPWLMVLAACGGGTSDGDPFCRTRGVSVLLDAADPTPPGWTCVSCTDGDPFFERFVLGGQTAGSTGGSAQHAHAFTAMQTGSSSSTSGVDNAAGTVAVTSGAHGMASGTTTMVDHLPRYRDMKVIRANAPVSELPAGAIVILDSAAMPAGFTRYFAQDGRFIRGGATPAMGGAAEHQHMFDVMLPTASTAMRPAGTDRTVATAQHVHTVGGTSGTFVNAPQHAIVVLARADAATEIPAGAIVMFDDAPPDGWTITLVDEFLLADAAADLAPHGSHHHGAEITVMSTAASDSVQVLAGTTNVATGTHTHQVKITFADVDHRPPYREVIFAQRAGGCD
jgi:hypothetical protein